MDFYSLKNNPKNTKVHFNISTIHTDVLALPVILKLLSETKIDF
jgi:hypothetical protein